MKALSAKVVSAESPGDQIRRLQRMLEATKFLGATLDLRKLTKIILQIIRREVPVDRVTAFTIDRKLHVLRSVVAQGVKDVVIEVPVGVGVAGAVAQTNETLDVSDAQNDVRFYGGIDRLLGYHTRDIFCLPIRSRNGDVAGVLELLNRARPINDLDKTFLNDISVHIGLALELAWSHREVLDRERLERQFKAQRERLIQLDRVRLMTEMLGSVMHELNNPLAVLMGNVELLKMRMEPQAQAAPYIDKIEAAAHRSSLAVRKFTKFIRSPRGKRCELNLPDLLQQTAALRQAEWQLAGISVHHSFENVPVVMANEDDMHHVFLNILKNAEEAMRSSRSKPRIDIRCSHDPASECVRVDIKDNGYGMTPDIRSRIFEPFFSTKRNGTGLGLTIARRIIEEHDGKFTFETKASAGTTFTIELPCHAARPN